MDDKKLVSVVIPAYNAENSIRDCLNAAISQTYKNIEIIIIDDGSKDNTAYVGSCFMANDDRIKVIRQENSGPSVARNKGISVAHGDYIVFWDADDYPEPDLIESYVKAYENWKDKEVAFVLCGMFFDNRFNTRIKDTVSILESSWGYVEGENCLMIRSTAAVLSYLKLFNFVTNKCYDLNMIKEYGITFDDKIRIAEDLKFNLDYLDKCKGYFGMINRPLYHYVKRSGDNLSISYHRGDLEDTKAVYSRFVDWEQRQLHATDDNVAVIKGIYLRGWVGRLTSMYEACLRREEPNSVKRTIIRELHCKEFRKLLGEVYKAKKISTLRYVCLRTGDFRFFYFFRGIYQKYKG